MRVIEKLRGHGTVTRQGAIVLEHVPYQLTLWLERHGGTDGDDEGRRQINGRIGVSFLDASRLMAFHEPLVLTLEDGRTLHFFLTNSSGRIAPSDGGRL
jgi:hypothetical protein